MQVNHIEHKPFQWIHTSGAFSSRCDLDVYMIRERTAIAVATERENDAASGMSISNGADILATIVMQKYRLGPNGVIWIEHYPEKRMGKNSIYKMDEIYQRVRFGLKGNRFISPQWEKLDNEGTRAFINALRADRGSVLPRLG
ncbi:hypothetical protein DENIS_3378 [Desulfonema ishimotonii]|uniref:Uncharacterized protein n=2 Tax=Desulfonema ishimotonii TaxID=45657 RepID=A0A401FZP0_9BACT|nr:hypothetical protein DENIS_3378 [Desulfonema ishimotonii]